MPYRILSDIHTDLRERKHVVTIKIEYRIATLQKRMRMVEKYTLGVRGIPKFLFFPSSIRAKFYEAVDFEIMEKVGKILPTKYPFSFIDNNYYPFEEIHLAKDFEMQVVKGVDNILLTEYKKFGRDNLLDGG